MKSALIFLFVATCLLLQVTGGLGKRRKRSLKKQLSEYLLSKRRAATFDKRGKCDHDIVGLLKRDCCDKVCTFEERAEYSEDCGWTRTNDVVCELSIREGKSCKCKTSKGVLFECASSSVDVNQACICGESKFWCGTGRKCVLNSQKCDSKNDCGNYNDEKGCKIPTGLSITLESGQPRYSGNVFIGGRPVCRTDWGTNDAKVVCKQLGFSDHTKARSFQNGYFGATGRNYIISEVECTGSETNLRNCPHNTMPDSYCLKYEGAGVECMDPLTLTLKEGANTKEGFVYLSDYAACSDRWWPAASQVVCNQLFKSEMHGTGNVPVFTTRSYFLVSTDRFVINYARCNGDEDYLTDCYDFMTYFKSSCRSGKRVKVQCAKCFASELVSIIQSVVLSNDAAQTRNSVNQALTTLTTTCYNWDCSKTTDTHPDYCLTKAALEDLAIILENREKKFLLTNRFNVKDKLQHNFIKSQFSDLQNSLNGLQTHITSFQTQLSQYFVQTSQYQETRLQGEIRDLISLVHDLNIEKQEQEDKFESLVQTLVAHSTASVAAEFAHRMIRLAFRIVQTYVQKDPTVLFDVDDELAAVAKAGNNFASIAFLVQLVPKFVATSQNIVDNTKANKDAFLALAQLLDDENVMTYDQAKSYSRVSIVSPYGVTDLSDMQIYLEDIVDGLCDVLVDGETLSSQLAQTGATVSGICHKTKLQAGKVIAYHEQIHDVYLGMSNYVKDIAKSKLEVHLAEQMAGTLSHSLGNQVKMAITRLQSMIVLRVEKRNLIQEACQTITYMNHNVELPACASLRVNIDGSLSPLLSFDYERDMCSDFSTVQKYINFPLDMQNPEFDITDILPQSSSEEGQLYFEIPNNQWLADHGWIDQYSTRYGPFYLKSVQIIPPPMFPEHSLTISSTVAVVENIVANQDWNFQENLSAMSSVLMNGVCSESTRPNPYNLPGCPTNLPVCLTSEGKFGGPMYPSLKSKFSIKFRHNKPIALNFPSPKTPLFLKARVEFCYKSQSKRGLKVENFEKRGTCCASNGSSYYNIANQLKGLPPCQACPAGTKPAMHGYYCEEA